jgi:hypothetical protein
MTGEIKKFGEFNKIDENVQSAKALLLRNAIKDKTKKLNLSSDKKVQLTPEEEKRALSNPKYIEIRDYFLDVAKNPGLVGPFTYFRVEENLPMGNIGDDPEEFTVLNLKKKLDDASPIFGTFPLPLGNIESYIKSKKNNERSYEKLWDDLDLILSKRPMKTFIDNFVGPIRQEFAKSLKLADEDAERGYLIDRLYHIVQDLKNLKPLYNEKTQKNESGEEQLINNASKYKDTRTYPEYKDTYIAFKEFIRDCDDKVSGWSSDIGGFIDELKSISPSIKILEYDKVEKKVVTSARSAEGMRSICKIANATLCIKTDSTFWSYTSGSLQISISLLGLKKTDEKYLTSLTINSSGIIVDSANRSNQRIHNNGENYIDFLKRYGLYSESTAKAIEDSFESELAIKKIVETISKQNTGNKVGKSKLIQYLRSLEVKKATAQGLYTEEEMNQFKTVIIAIIKNDNNITYNEVIDTFTDVNGGGFFTIGDIELFEALTGNKYNKADIKIIYDITSATIERFKVYFDNITKSNNPGDKGAKALPLLNELLRIYPEVKMYIESKML